MQNKLLVKLFVSMHEYINDNPIISSIGNFKKIVNIVEEIEEQQLVKGYEFSGKLYKQNHPELYPVKAKKVAGKK